jgi:hypothetical protein
MNPIYRYQVDESTKSLQPDETTSPRGQARVFAFIPRDTRRAVWDLVMTHDRSVREVRVRTGLTERQIIDVLKERAREEVQRAVMLDRLRRAPRDPAKATQMAA